MINFIVFQTTDEVIELERAFNAVVKHFMSIEKAQQFMNGIIDWNGNPIEDHWLYE